MRTGSLPWRIHTPALLDEIARNPQCEILRIPLTILKQLLAAVGERCAELNDPRLNELMIKLTVYACADPYDPGFDQELVDKVLGPGPKWSYKKEL